MVEVHVRVAVPEPVTVPGVIAPQLRFIGMVSVRVTIPAKPFNPVIVIVDVAEPPTVTDAGEVAVIVKSVKFRLALAVWVRDPLAAVTVSG